ncbi:hypothetical protein TSOC_010276 [Tetrabaena socialis]|uniref:Uncharacterized protein n=1 Tax=Tetrabaena socialis TaxID=47790 RepID=A0A2J7ZTQ1_9CHLO|nr:hypothetical protein TSOC_010276 [Tetrabaena socialis]|eukprot:PNH03649.1 hypothetical protein TSOC_010276 [Tetrabaena socialis]
MSGRAVPSNATHGLQYMQQQQQQQLQQQQHHHHHHQQQGTWRCKVARKSVRAVARPGDWQLVAQALNLLGCVVYYAIAAVLSLPSLLLFYIGARRARGDGDPLSSATFYEGHTLHIRRAPKYNKFRYAVRVAVVDLEAPPAWFKAQAADHLTPGEARKFAGTEGPVRLLTDPMAAGYVQNPISVYYCYARSGDGGAGRLQRCIAEVTNTPWNERVRFVFDPSGQSVQKALHVSPFMDMQNTWCAGGLFFCVGYPLRSLELPSAPSSVTPLLSDTLMMVHCSEGCHWKSVTRCAGWPGAAAAAGSLDPASTPAPAPEASGWDSEGAGLPVAGSSRSEAARFQMATAGGSGSSERAQRSWAGRRGQPEYASWRRQLAQE